MPQPIYLLLEDGTYFAGKAFGAPTKETIGELVFTTGMTGYLETLTDPSYYGQMVIQTFPLIGNYGVISEDFESNFPKVQAYIVREWCECPSNFRCEKDLDTFLKSKQIPGMSGIDTRQLTKIIREHGVMNAKLTTKQPPYSLEDYKDLQHFQIRQAVQRVTCKQITTYATEQPKYHIVLWDFGTKKNIIRELKARHCNVTVVPAQTTANEIISLRPDGVMLSNGPGDPKENTEIIKQLTILCNKKIPIFGICLGHQLLALATGAQTEKLKYGHRGANQPVKDLSTGRVYITSQNHGYAVKNESLPPQAKLQFINVNDGTCEGITYANMPAFSVQFHPEACGGPQDTKMLFDRFLQMVSIHQQNTKEAAVCH